MKTQLQLRIAELSAAMRREMYEQNSKSSCSRSYAKADRLNREIMELEQQIKQLK